MKWAIVIVLSMSLVSCIVKFIANINKKKTIDCNDNYITRKGKVISDGLKKELDNLIGKDTVIEIRNHSDLDGADLCILNSMCENGFILDKLSGDCFTDQIDILSQYDTSSLNIIGVTHNITDNCYSTLAELIGIKDCLVTNNRGLRSYISNNSGFRCKNYHTIEIVNCELPENNHIVKVITAPVYKTISYRRLNLKL